MHQKWHWCNYLLFTYTAYVKVRGMWWLTCEPHRSRAHLSVTTSGARIRFPSRGPSRQVRSGQVRTHPLDSPLPSLSLSLSLSLDASRSDVPPPPPGEPAGRHGAELRRASAIRAALLFFAEVNNAKMRI